MRTNVTIAPPSYEFLFQKPTMFPKAVEKPLRAALLAAEKAEYQESEAHFQRYAYSSPFLVTGRSELCRAYEALKTVPREELMPSPDLKISGLFSYSWQILTYTDKLFLSDRGGSSVR